MNDRRLITYRAARAIVFGDRYPPLLDGHPLSDRICYPIEPSCDLFLLGAGNQRTGAEADAAQFIAEAWSRIPAADRDRIVVFWRGEGCRSPHLSIEWAPQIEIRDHWFTSGANNYASTLDGTLFYFHRSTITTPNAERVRTAAAHEFAHALQRANGEWGKQRPIPKMSAEERLALLTSRLRCTKENLGTVLLAHNRTAEEMIAYILSDDETRTDDILRSWGFDPSVLN